MYSSGLSLPECIQHQEGIGTIYGVRLVQRYLGVQIHCRTPILSKVTA